MIKARQRLFLEFFSVFCCLVVVFISASTITGAPSRPQLIGLVAGSFGAGAALVNAIRDYAVHRGKGKGDRHRESHR
jgi:hypothetical protein